MTRRLIGTIGALAIACLGVACDEKLTDLAGPTPNLTPTFTSIQRDIFNAKDSSGRPACTSCHSAGGARFTGNLSLVEGAAYANLVGVASTGKAGETRVIPGNPDGSYLLKKLEGNGIVGDRMPRLGPYLSEGQILIIRRWIELGAKND